MTFSGCINLSQDAPNALPPGGIWRGKNGQFSFSPSPRSTPSSMRTAATTSTPSRSSARVKIEIMKMEVDAYQLPGAKLLTTYEMHYQTDGNSFSFIKGRWVVLFGAKVGHLMRNPNTLIVLLGIFL